MNFKENTAQNHAPDEANVSAAEGAGHFPPITVAIGQQVDLPGGKRGTQPHYSRAEHKTFHSIDELAAALQAHKFALSAHATPEERQAVKGRLPYWTIGGLRNGGSETRITGAARDDEQNDVYRRKTANIAPANMIAIDLDECGQAFYSRATFADLLDKYQGVMYQTPSFTSEAPRVRILLTTTKPIEPKDKREVFTRFEYAFMQSIGAVKVEDKPHAWEYEGESVVFDECMLKGNQVIYLPANNAEVFIFDGQPVDVDALPPLPEGVHLRQSANDAQYTRPEDLSDAAAWLLEHGHAEEHDAKTLNIRCPWHDEHRDEASRNGQITNGTVFKMDADPRAERFHCSHSHGDVINADQTAFARAFGMPEDITLKAWGSVAHVDEFDVIETSAGEVVAAGTVTPNPILFKLPDSELATLITRHLPGTALDLESGEFYRYQADPKAPAFGTWQPWNENRLAGFTASTFDLYGSPYQVAKINSVVKAVRIKAQRLQPQAAAAVIPFANGVFNLQSATFSEHRPENWLLSTNGITWSEAEEGENLEEHAPNFAAWLDFVSEGNAAKALSIKALFYAVLTNRYQWQKFYELTGPGASGKGTAMQLCELLAGKDSAVSIDAESLDDARKREPVALAKLITLPDQKQYTGDGNGLRAITGGDSVSIDPKHKKPYSAVIRAVIVAANNSPMIFTERAGGIDRRRIIFHFGRVVPEAQRDRALMDKMSDELPVVIRDLLATFPNGKGAEAAIIAQKESAEAVQVKSATDPLTCFASMLNFGNEPEGLALGIAQARKFNADEGAFAPEQVAIYPCYQRYCEAYGVQALSLNKFRDGMKQAAGVHGATFTTGTRRNIKGTAGKKETPTNVISYKPELMEYVPTCLDVEDDLTV